MKVINKIIYLLLFISGFVLAEDGKSLWDSILKYKFTNPAKAIDFSIEFTNQNYDVKPTQIIQQTYGLIGEIHQRNK